MNKQKNALDRFEQNQNCSQSVLASFHRDFNLEEQQLMDLAAGFGGGMASTGKTCGAVSGAYMAIGLYSGTLSKDNAIVKKVSKEKILEFNRIFESEFGCLDCKDLLGYDFSKPGEHEKAEELGLFKSKCPKFVAKAVETVEKIMGNPTATIWY